MDWIHCNACFIVPSTTNKVTFCISSCGHLFCANCLSKKNVGPGSSTGDLCYICKKKCNYLEVNRSLRQDLQVFFKQPRELISQYLRTMKSVIEFQTFHRGHLQKHLNDKTKSEMSKKMEREQILTVENAKLKAEIKSLKKMLSGKDREMAQARERSASRPPRSSGHPNTSSPMSTHSPSSSTKSRLNRSGSGLRLVSLDSPLAFSGSVNNSSINSSMCSDSAHSTSITTIPYQPLPTTALKPTILASYSNSSTSSRSSSMVSGASRTVMSGRIAKGSIVPLSSKNLVNQTMKF